MMEAQHFVVYVQMDSPARRDTKKIQQTLKMLLEQKEHCPNCGGLVPELSFQMDGKQFTFTCHEIAEMETWKFFNEKETHKPRKVLAQTDYKQFAKYCAKKE